MLKIVDVVPVLEGCLIIDDYIPFRFRLTDEVLPSPYLWRTGNFKTTLLEITIDRNSHTIFDVTLICFAGKLQTDLQQGYDSAEFVEGLPVVDVNGYPQPQREDVFDFRVSKCDEVEEIKAYREGNNFFLVFGGEKVPNKCIKTNRVGFFACATELCGIAFFELSQSEISTVLSLMQP